MQQRNLSVVRSQALGLVVQVALATSPDELVDPHDPQVAIRVDPVLDPIHIHAEESIGNVSVPNLTIQKEPVGPGSVYRSQIDLFSSYPEHEVQRLVDLAVTMAKRAREGFDYVTLADPKGSRFDVLPEVMKRGGPE